jgi:hypothetical protein
MFEGLHVVAALQLDDRTAAAIMRANQPRLSIDAMAHVALWTPSVWPIRSSPRPLVAQFASSH